MGVPWKSLATWLIEQAAKYGISRLKKSDAPTAKPPKRPKN